MAFSSTDKFNDVASALGSLVIKADELALDPPPSLSRKTLLDFQRALADAARVLQQLEEQLDSASP